MKFLDYEPDQAWLLPPSVKDVLGPDHLCFFVHNVVERLDPRPFAEGYGEEGRRAYAPALMSHSLKRRPRPLHRPPRSPLPRNLMTSLTQLECGPPQPPVAPQTPKGRWFSKPPP
jgi:hypothetical protein